MALSEDEKLEREIVRSYTHRKKRAEVSQETRARMSMSAKCRPVEPRNNPMYGKTHCNEALTTLANKAKINWKDPEYARKVQQSLHAPSEIVARVAMILYELKLLPGDFEYNGESDAGVSIDGLTPDFVSLERKLIIEVNGTYWHSNLDLERRRLLRYQNAGYRTLAMWDYELQSLFDYAALVDKIQRFL